MLTYAFEDDRALTQLYDRTLTAVNPANVQIKKTATVPIPFQPASVFPLGRPPVRYPDVTTIPGFVSDPREDETELRNILGAMASRDPPGTVNAKKIDWEPEFKNAADYQTDKGQNGPTVLEAMERAFKPMVQEHPPHPGRPPAFPT